VCVAKALSPVHIPLLCALSQELEKHQAALHQRQLWESKEAADQLRAAHEAVRDAFLRVHASLSPNNLAVVFGQDMMQLVGGASFSLSVEQYEELTGRLMGSHMLDAEDANHVAVRVHEALGQVCVDGLCRCTLQQMAAMCLLGHPMPAALSAALHAVDLFVAVTFVCAGAAGVRES